MDTLRLFLCGLLLAAGPTLSAAQPPASPDEANLAKALAAAKTDAERTALADASPALVTQSLVRRLLAEGNQKMSARDPIPADAAYAAAFWVADRMDWIEGRMRAFLGRGTIAGQTGNYESAIGFLRQAAALSEGRDNQDLAASLNNLGIVYRLRGDYDEALACYRRTQALATETGRQDTVARALHNIAHVLSLKGQYRASLEHYERSLQIKEKLATPDVFTTLNNIGGVHETLGNPALALSYYTRSLERAEQSANRVAAASAVSNIGHVKANERNYDEALTYFRRALSMHEAAGNRADQATALENIGTAARAQGRVSDALEHLERSLAIREALGAREGIAASLVEIATTHLGSGNADRARDAIARAIAIASEIGVRSALYKAQTLAGDAALLQGRLDEAARAYTEATAVIEALRQEVAGGASERARFFENKLHPYYSLALVHLRAGRLADAFAASERARARGLFDVLNAGERTIGSLSADERERERQVERTIAAANAQIAAETARPRPDPARLAALRNALSRARLDREDLLARLYAAHPDLPFARGETPTITAEAAAALIDRDAALVEYLVTPRESWAFVVTRGEQGAVVTAHDLGTSGDALGRSAAAFRGQLGTRDLAFSVSARRLHQTLIAPLERRLAGRRLLLVVPDGPLWQLPFQALVARSGRYLLEEHAIAYTPSAGALDRLRDRQRRRASNSTATLLAIGDPTTGATVASATRAAGTLQDASRELRAIASLYGPGSTRLYTGSDATEARFRAEAGGAAIVHVATHGILDDGNAMYSYIALGGQGAGEGEDGRLEAREIRQLRMAADVAVLSACETALGRIRAGEGILGLSWALFAAGTGSAVVSQWQVDAASTADLMIALHRQMRAASARDRRLHPAESLRRAALGLMRTPRYRHPFYWAGFLVIGQP